MSTPRNQANGYPHDRLTDERTPLLPGADVGENVEAAYDEVFVAEANERANETANSPDPDDKPLPMGQIAILCYARLVEPLAFFGIFPFVNQMIKDTGGLKEEDVGFYSGLIESLFSLTQVLVMIWWGRAADRFGRKPVMITSLIGSTITCSLFGFSKTVWQMILFRCLAGVFSGTIITVRAMISENSTSKTQARAFSWFAFTGNVGIFLGPLIGGTLVDPARQFPTIFGNVQWLRDFPYGLPTLASGFFAATAALLAVFGLKETLPKQKDRAPGSVPPMTMWEMLKSPGVIAVLVIYGYTMMLALSYTAVIPVFWFTHPALGGFGFSPKMISLFMAFSGFSQAVWLLLAFPKLQHRFGTGSVLRACAAAWPIGFAMGPLCSILLRMGHVTGFWILSVTTLALSSGTSMAFTGTQLILNDISPSPEVFGTLNAIYLTMLSAVRTIAPEVATSIYAFGVGHHILGGYFVWVFLIGLAIGYNFVLRLLPGKCEGRPIPRPNQGAV